MDLAPAAASPPPPSLAVACDRAAGLGRPVLLSIARPLATPPDALPLVAAARRAGISATLLERRGDDVAVAAFGIAWKQVAAGCSRFDAVRTAADALFADAVVDGDVPPLAVAAFAFADATPGGAWRGFAAAQAVVPRIALLQRGGTATRVVNLIVAPGEGADAVAARLHRTLVRMATWRAGAAAAAGAPAYRARPEPEPAAWQRAVADTVADVAGGRFDKLVLARTCRLESDEPFACDAAVDRLRRTYPSCTTFWIGGADGDVVGATPETLVRVCGREMTTAALAGTAGRGTTAAADDAIARGLLASVKDRHEHAVVVDALRDALTPLCEELAVEAAPQLVRLANVHHLRTAVRGRLAARVHVLDVVARLHPTPAVAGAPRAAALAALPGRERFERGWYAGPIGWFDAAGDGELDVALRCALIRDRTALLYAGAGIVAGSDPVAELEETRLKLQPLLGALMEV